jgi:hypothetical protein
MITVDDAEPMASAFGAPEYSSLGNSGVSKAGLAAPERQEPGSHRAAALCVVARKRHKAQLSPFVYPLYLE